MCFLNDHAHVVQTTIIRPLPKPGCCKIGFRQISLNIYILYLDEAPKQYSILETVFDYIFHFGPPGKHQYLSPTNRLSVGRRSRPRIVGFLDLFIDSFLEVQN